MLMKKMKWFGLFLTLALLVTAIVPLAGAAPSNVNGSNEDPEFVPKNDNLPDPLTTKQLELKQQALEAKLNGKGNAYGKVGEVARGQYVPLALEGTGMIWTVQGEFSDYPHNSIPEPDRTVNNTTYWVPDFTKTHIEEILYSRTPGVNSLANFYLEQSSGRYTVAGEATDWIPVGNHLIYDDNPDPNVWLFLRDTVNGWYNAQIAAGKTPAQINEYLSKFDKRDRYDYNGN